MNNELRKILEENNIPCKKITLKNNVSIISNDHGRYVIKKNNNNLKDVYRYLDSRSFDYYPELILNNNDYNIFEYIDGINITNEEKAKDIMHIIGLLHAKTTYYKEIDIDDYKKIYEDVDNKLKYLNNYYLDLMTIIDKEIYMSPSHYLLARNINIIFGSIELSKILIDKWYNIINEKKKVRLATIHNNLDVDHYIRNTKSYLLSWEKTKIDLPFYDLLPFYKKYALSLDFNSLFSQYESVYPMLLEEKILLFSLMIIPEKIDFNNKEYQMCKKIRHFIDYLYRSRELITNYDQTILPTKDSVKSKAYQ